jgi:hypothetical protein
VKVWHGTNTSSRHAIGLWNSTTGHVMLIARISFKRDICSLQTESMHLEIVFAVGSGHHQLPQLFSLRFDH